MKNPYFPQFYVYKNRQVPKKEYCLFFDNSIILLVSGSITYELACQKYSNDEYLHTRIKGFVEVFITIILEL